MKTWLLSSISLKDRSYQGNKDYQDDISRVYRYDSYVPNHKNISQGDIALIRDKTWVLGCAVIERLSEVSGSKERSLCPSCNTGKFKVRKTIKPRFRCECGHSFEKPVITTTTCTLFEAQFGNTFQELKGLLKIQELWDIAIRLNKQLSILELDSAKAAEKIDRSSKILTCSDEAPIAARNHYIEGKRTMVLVDRYERSPTARKECLKHHGYQCAACAFSFEARYGKLGLEVIEVHHLSPLSQCNSAGRVDPIKDLIPLCSNCHTMIHRTNPPMTLDELRAILK